MASGGGDAKSLTQWLREKGFDEETIGRMSKRCKNLPNLDASEASGVWDYLLNDVKIEQRKLRYVVTKCPKVLTVSVDRKLVPTVQCLNTLQAKPGEVAQAIIKFPPILFHSMEQKLCPLLAFFQTLDISEKQLAKLLMVNPRLISYSIEGKFSQTVDFFVSLGIEKEGMIGKILTKEPYILGYSVDKRLRPTAEFLKSVVGLEGTNLQRVIMNFPGILSRDANKTLRPNFMFLQSAGFSKDQIMALVAGYPLVLIKSIKRCLEPRVKFLVEEMGRDRGEAVDYPQFFSHGLRKSLEYRHKILKQMNSRCSLSEMLDCNQKKFAMKFGLIAAV
ncbi:transcription termination factor MTERF6, chloroplastic/mitochondrial [Lolium perenne]|jgi:mTERF domain-containing protein|uniref:transcription termination factor MTERF6, chloroplastic/mitochondrial n=1 Tax=Lolium perenne TaxID=4522 RepID=UPI0021F5675E|nr:transcription termination factor MTERF6, chloroplastic/mitochondrial [Lolium perenne]